jgi:transposase
LQCAYLLKEKLAEFWQQKDGREAWAFLREWCAKAKTSGIRQLQAMAVTLLRYAKGVLSYYKTELTSGKWIRLFLEFRRRAVVEVSA